MKFLILLEWNKVKFYPVFRLMIICYLVLLPALTIIGKKIPGNTLILSSVESFYVFPGVWKYIGYLGNWISFIFLGYIGILLVTNEVKNRTLRQNLLTGLTRTQFCLGKIYFALLISLFSTLYYLTICLLSGFSNQEDINFHLIVENIEYVPRYFLMCFSYSSFGLFLGFLLRHTDRAFLIYMGYSFFIETFVRWGIHSDFLKNKSMHYYPMKATSDLIPAPYSEQAQYFIEENDFNLYLIPYESAIVVLIYLSIFLGYIFFKMRTADL